MSSKGDSASSPTAGTSPVWDASNNFVSVTAGQFLTIPLPSLSSTIPLVSTSISVAVWLRITTLPSPTTTLLSMHAADGTQVAYTLTAFQSTGGLSMTFTSISGWTLSAGSPAVLTNVWQLVGFSAYLSADKRTNEGTVFAGVTGSRQFYLENYGSVMDLSTATLLRIGGATGSFTGFVSAVRIMTPGGGIIRTTGLCSAQNSMKLGVGSFALICVGGSRLNTINSKCSVSCVGGTRLVAPFTGTPLCVSCPKSDCVTCDSTQCLTCLSSHILYQGSCLSSCPDGMYSDGTTCQSCPISCAKCTASTTCQACNSGYVLSNSFCYIPSLPSGKTETSASHAVASTVSAVGSVVSVGNSIFPIAGLVSEVVQNTRYLNLTVTDELTQIYKTFSTDLISWNLPNFLDNLNDYKPLSVFFSRYEIDSPFLTNFWSTMMTIGVSLCVLVCCLGIQRWYLERRKSRGFFDSMVQKVLAGSINFIVVQAYGCLDNILFYFVLDVKTNPLNTGFCRTSFAFGVIFIIGSVALMTHSVMIVKKYHVLKREGKDMKELEDHQKKNKYLEVFYGDFSDTDVWSHCFLAFLVLRSNISSLVLTLLYDYPLMQTLFLIALDGAILTFMLIEKPFTTLRGVFFQYYFEGIVLIVHICTFLLSWNDEPSESLKNGVCATIIYMNTALVTGALCFMSIEIHETVREKINEWKLKRAQKNAVAVFPLPEESEASSLQNDASVVGLRRSLQRTVQTGNMESSRDLHLREDKRNHLENEQIAKSRRSRIELKSKDFDLA